MIDALGDLPTDSSPPAPQPTSGGSGEGEGGFSSVPPGVPPEERKSRHEVFRLCDSDPNGCYRYTLAADADDISVSFVNGECCCTLESLKLHCPESQIYVPHDAEVDASLHELGHWVVLRDWWEADFDLTMKSVYDTWHTEQKWASTAADCPSECETKVKAALDAAMNPASDRLNDLQDKWDQGTYGGGGK